jgi:4-hydroxy-tetrahydrodipicolinate reductase
MSLGVTLLKRYIREAAALLGAPEFDIENSEVHHRHKKDAPSGTALEWGRAAAQGRGADFQKVACFPTRPGGRQEGDIGFAVQRGGAQALEHTLSFLGDEEMVCFSHRGFSRSLYAKGALKAVLWVLEQKKPGLYGMENVLGLS